MIDRWVTAGTESGGEGGREGGKSRPPEKKKYIPQVLITSTPADLFSQQWSLLSTSVSFKFSQLIYIHSHKKNLSIEAEIINCSLQSADQDQFSAGIQDQSEFLG